MGTRLRRISIATAMYRNGKSSWPPNVKLLGLTAVKYAIVPEISQKRLLFRYKCRIEHGVSFIH